MSRPRPLVVLSALAGLWVAVLVLAPLVGSRALGLGEILSGEGTAATIFWSLRVPRVLLGLLAGGGLAVSGVAFQTLFRNPLAEPYTLGVASGAALGAVLAQQVSGIAALSLLPLLGGLPLTAAASFAGALGAAAVVVGLGGSERARTTGTLLLAGIAVSLSCSALILLLQYLSDFTKTFRMLRWMMGGLGVVGYREVLWALPWVVLGSLALLARRWDLNQLLTGDELAASRGVDLRRLRIAVLGITSVMVGALVAVTGPIGFVGLIVPHILRRGVGHDLLHLLPAALLGGGAFLVLCDLVARTVLAPAELPVGILTALLGGPFFLWLLLVRR